MSSFEDKANWNSNHTPTSINSFVTYTKETFIDDEIKYTQYNIQTEKRYRIIKMINSVKYK